MSLPAEEPTAASSSSSSRASDSTVPQRGSSVAFNNSTTTPTTITGTGASLATSSSTSPSTDHRSSDCDDPPESKGPDSPLPEDPTPTTAPQALRLDTSAMDPYYETIGICAFEHMAREVRLGLAHQHACFADVVLTLNGHLSSTSSLDAGPRTPDSTHPHYLPDEVLLGVGSGLHTDPSDFRGGADLDSDFLEGEGEGGAGNI